MSEAAKGFLELLVYGLAGALLALPAMLAIIFICKGIW